MQRKALKPPSSLKLEFQGESLAYGPEETNKTLHKILQEVEASVNKYAGCKEYMFAVEDRLCDTMPHFHMTRLSKKFDLKHTDTYMLGMVINEIHY